MMAWGRSRRKRAGAGTNRQTSASQFIPHDMVGSYSRDPRGATSGPTHGTLSEVLGLDVRRIALGWNRGEARKIGRTATKSGSAQKTVGSDPPT
jgi:hypothetical protein